jgi:membrane protein YqaA with SNARE-associated domain
MIEEFMLPFTEWIVSLPFYQEFGTLIIFLLSFVPFAPIPAEPIVVPLLLAADELQRPMMLFQLSVLMSVGTLGSLGLLYYAAKHHLHKLIGKSKKLSPHHPIHKFGVYAFIFIPLLRGGMIPFMIAAPSLSILVPVATDLIIVFAGHFKIHAGKLFAFLTVGVIIKGIIDYMALAELVGI